MKLTLTLRDRAGAVLYENSGENETTFAYRGAYRPGERLCLTADRPGALLALRLDDSLDESRVFLRGTEFQFPIPFDAARKPYGEKAFTGERHWGFVRAVSGGETGSYIDLAHNSCDYGANDALFPHAASNVVVDDPKFFARNAIDGIFETCNHGSWPHGSWGINGRADARLRVELGRPVRADAVVLYLRADFPHDNWWRTARLAFSDGAELNLTLEKTGRGQKFTFSEKTIAWVELSELVMSDEESRFPALSQIMVLGREVN